MSTNRIKEGDMLFINGANFGNNPDNLCAVVMSGPNSVPMEVIEATDTQIRAMLGAVAPGAQPGQIMIGIGEGARGRFRPAFFDVFVADDVWTWDRKGGPRSRVGYVPICVDELGNMIPWAECIEPLHVEGGKLKTRLPRNKPHEFFRLYRQPPVLTNPD